MSTWNETGTFDGGTSYDSVDTGASYDRTLAYAPGTDVSVTDFTARLYARLPDCYRDADVTAPGQGAGSTAYQFPLLRWLACLCDQAGQIEDSIESFAEPTTSALTDPNRADPSWLPWLGQLVGVDLTLPLADVAEARSDIADAISVPKGSRQSIINALQSLLSGTKTVTVTDHYGGNAWEIQVDTLAAETPATVPGQQGFVWGTSQWGTTSAVWADSDGYVWYLESKGLRPAGFLFVHTTS